MDKVKHIDLCITNEEEDDEETERCRSLDSLLKTLSTFDNIIEHSECLKKLVIFAAIDGAKRLGCNETQDEIFLRVIERWQPSIQQM